MEKMIFLLLEFISEKVSTDYWMWLDADDMITQENLYRSKTIKRNNESEHRYGYDGLCHRFR